jgi:hypothetical protein
MEKIIIGAVVGLVVGAAAKDVLKALGVPQHAATVIGGIIGGLA